ncbi:MAG TPA: SGNH/GDSL hydrolase family protein [Planctomycetota bacterium]|nr:SGNH/GDSL hydrolase family protein [Planctomycetota bacterium]
MRTGASVGILLISVVFCAGCFPNMRYLVKSEFAGNTASSGWTALPNGDRQPQVEALPDGVKIAAGTWEGPAFTVKPFDNCKLEFAAKSDGRGYWCAAFKDAKGEVMIADHYSSFDPSADWVACTFCLRAKANAVSAVIRFQPQDGKPVMLRNVMVSHASKKQVAQWADSVHAAIPPVNYTPPSDRFKYIPDTLAKLRKGGKLRVVFLGDSIANDTGSSPLDVLLGRMYPKAKIEVVTSVGGGTCCQWYKNENRVEQYVLDYKPDLLIIAGISHGYDTESMRSVIRQVRAQASPDIMIMSGAVTPEQDCRDGYVRYSKLPSDTARNNAATFADRLRSLAAEEKVELFDMRTAWDEYVAGSGKPNAWFMRDPVHANCRGRQVLARIIERYFRPEK